MLAEPIALLGLLGLIPLTALYLLHRRSKPRPVSSLLLWEHMARHRVGGRRVDRLRTPLSYVLECLALASLALAAAGLLIRADSARPPLVLVLDNSLSMTAQRGDGVSSRERADVARPFQGVSSAASSRKRAERALRQEWSNDPPVAVVLAGSRPRSLSAADRATPDAVFARWTTDEPAADMAAAYALARDIGGPRARLMVVTDRAPEPAGTPISPEVRWRAFGRLIDNVGLVNAVRDGRSVLVEVCNFGTLATERSVRILVGDAIGAASAGDPGRTERVSLAPGERKRLRFAVTAPGRTVSVTMEGDALAFDDRLTLAPTDRPPLRAAVRMMDRALQGAITRALASSGLAIAVDESAEIEFTDGPALPTPLRWVVAFTTPSEPAQSQVHSGPFAVDQSHPIGEGLDLSGVVWAAPNIAAEFDPGDTPVIVAGATTLLSERTSADAGRSMRVVLDARRSNITSHPAWPVLIWNMLAWRDAAKPGPERANVPIGRPVRVRVLTPECRHIDPDGNATSARAIGGVISLECNRAGLHRVEAGAAAYSFAVLPVAPAESDLAAAATMEQGRWPDEQAGQPGVHSLAWLIGLVALGVLIGHAWLLASRGASA